MVHKPQANPACLGLASLPKQTAWCKNILGGSHVGQGSVGQALLFSGSEGGICWFPAVQSSCSQSKYSGREHFQSFCSCDRDNLSWIFRSFQWKPQSPASRFRDLVQRSREVQDSRPSLGSERITKIQRHFQAHQLPAEVCGQDPSNDESQYDICGAVGHPGTCKQVVLANDWCSDHRMQHALCRKTIESHPVLVDCAWQCLIAQGNKSVDVADFNTTWIKAKINTHSGKGSREPMCFPRRCRQGQGKSSRGIAGASSAANTYNQGVLSAKFLGRTW